MDMTATRCLERLIVTGCCPVLLVIGYKLFVKGASGVIELTAKSGRASGRAANMAPGAFCFLLGTLLGAYVLFSRVDVKYSSDGTPKVVGAPVFISGLGGESRPEDRASAVIRRMLSDYVLQTYYLSDEARELKLQELRTRIVVPRESELSELESLEAQAARSVSETGQADPQVLANIARLTHAIIK